MKKGLLKAAAVLLCMLVFGMSQVVSVSAAGDDIVLNDAGSPLIRVIDPGEGSNYTYMGYVYCGEGIGSEYGYLQLSYKGDETAFTQLRIEILDGSDQKIGVFWFSENAEGSFRTSDGNLLPAPTSEVQTVVVDFAASGIDVSNGIHAMHIHDTQGIGAVTFTDARLMTSPAGASDADAEPAENTEAQDETDVQAEPVNDVSGEEVSEDAGIAADDLAAGASDSAPQTGERQPLTNAWLICCCGIVFTAVCTVVKVLNDRK